MEQDEKNFGQCKAGFARCEELLPTLPEGSEVRNAIAALLSEYHHTVEEERKVRELVREVERGSDRTIYTQHARIRINTDPVTRLWSFCDYTDFGLRVAALLKEE